MEQSRPSLLEQYSFSSNALDILRIISALCVFLEHFNRKEFCGTLFSWVPSGLGHIGVIVFFTLSGFVISDITLSRKTNMQQFIIQRLARFYSVLIPAMILTLIADSIGSALFAELYINKVSVWTQFFQRTGVYLLFLQQHWSLGTEYYSNSPLWSLAYEFWYYITFAAFIYTKKTLRWVLTLLILTSVGPKILLLFPAWLAGVAAKFLVEKCKTDFTVFFKLSGTTIIICTLDYFFKLTELTQTFLNSNIPIPLGPSQSFANDFKLSILLVNLMLLIFLVEFTFPKVQNLFFVKRNIGREIASWTFSLYAYHFPILLLLCAVFEGIAQPYKAVVLATVSLILCYLLSLVTESKTHLLREKIKTIANKLPLN